MRFQVGSAAAALEVVLKTLDYARTTTEDFAFQPLETEQMLKNGFTVTGDVPDLRTQLLSLSGVVLAE